MTSAVCHKYVQKAVKINEKYQFFLRRAVASPVSSTAPLALCRATAANRALATNTGPPSLCSASASTATLKMECCRAISSRRAGIQCFGLKGEKLVIGLPALFFLGVAGYLIPTKLSISHKKQHSQWNSSDFFQDAGLASPAPTIAHV